MHAPIYFLNSDKLTESYMIMISRLWCIMMFVMITYLGDVWYSRGAVRPVSRRRSHFKPQQVLQPRLRWVETLKFKDFNSLICFVACDLWLLYYICFRIMIVLYVLNKSLNMPDVLSRLHWRFSGTLELGMWLKPLYVYTFRYIVAHVNIY